MNIPDIEIKLEKVSDEEESNNSEQEEVEPRRKRINRELHTNKAIPPRAFKRMVKEITAELTGGKDMRWQSDALEALHEDAETFMIENFDKCNQIKKLCKSVTLQHAHMVQALRS